jgi:phospholipid/cholesterol/gamma-HCH transport system substrate-binding protein
LESKARYTLIGGFVVLFCVGIFAFVIWLSEIDLQDRSPIYLIHFTGSVTGLRVGESVRFHGIPIGTVKKIAPSEEDPETIVVKVTIERPALIREDSIATIEVQGLTGYSYVQIEGGSRYSPILKAKPGHKYPIIPSQPSRIEEFFKAAPKIVASLSDLSDRLNRFFNEERLQDFARILQNIATLTETKNSGSIPTVLTELEQSLQVFTLVLRKVNQQFDPLSAELTQTLRSVHKTAQQLEGILAENRSELREFVGNGLDELTTLMNEARTLILHMNKVLQEVESGPARFLHKNAQQGYQAE